MIEVVLGLDVSTAVIGYAFLPMGADATTHPVMRGHIDLRRNKGGFWSKVDQMERELFDVIARAVTIGHRIVRLCIEDPLQRFRKGLSSAHTIALLAKFNVLVASHARRLRGVDPLYIDATAARKKIGVPLLSKKKSNGIDQKVQTFQYLCKGIFKDEKWPLNRNG